MLEALTRLRAGLAECADAPAWAVSDTELVASLDAAHRLEQAAAAVKLHLVREIDARDLPTAAHASSTAGWLRERLRVNVPTARRLVAHARELDGRPQLDQALGTGLINTEHLAAIIDTVADLPADLGTETVDKAQTLLIDWAQQFEAHSVRRLGARILEHVAPDVAERAEAAALARDEGSAGLARAFTMSPAGGGRVRLSGWLDTEAAATVAAALEPLCVPRRAGAVDGHGRIADGPGQTGDAPGLAADGRGLTGDAPGLAADGRGLSADARRLTAGGSGPAADGRSPAQRRADALVEVCQLALRTGELPVNGGDRPQLTVTVDFDALRERVGVGTLDTGDRLTAAQVRRLACDAQILPAVLGGQGQVLDVGQSRRLFTGPLRRALVLRDGGCAFPACDRPPRWCDAHHITSWLDGGPTALTNAVLLCRHHHRVIHHGGWTVRPGHDGRPEFLPPEHVDPHRRARRNIYHRRN